MGRGWGGRPVLVLVPYKKFGVFFPQRKRKAMEGSKPEVTSSHCILQSLEGREGFPADPE
jgi:hypothetical protein